MANNIVQLQNKEGDNIYPIAGGATQGAISKSMLEEGVFEGPEISQPSSVEFVDTVNIVDGAVTADKISASYAIVPPTDFGFSSGVGAEFFKIGKIITVSIYAANSTSAAQKSIAIPSGFEPSKSYMLPYETTDNLNNPTSYDVLYVSVGNRTINTAHNVAASRSLVASFTYLGE